MQPATVTPAAPPTPAEQLQAYLQQQENRIQRLETQNQQIINAIETFNNLIAQQQQPNDTATNSQTQNPLQNPQILALLGPLLQGAMQEPDPWITAMKQKALQGMDLSNQLAATFIQAITTGKLRFGP